MAVITATSFKLPFIILICVHITSLASPGFASDWVQIPSQVQIQTDVGGELQTFNITVKAVTISSDYVWGVDDRPTFPPGNLVLCELPCTDGNWIDGGGQLDHIDADSRLVWGTNSGGLLFRRTIDASQPFGHVVSFDPFQPKCFCSCDITVSENGRYVWVVLCLEIAMFDGSNWTIIPHEMSLTQIEADNEEVWAVDGRNNIFKRPVDGSGDWSSVPGEMRYISASGNAHVWGIAPNNSLYVCEKPCTGCWQYVGGSFQQIDGGNNAVVGVTTNNSIFVMFLEDFQLQVNNCPTMPEPTTVPALKSSGSPSSLGIIIATLAGVIILLLLVLIVGGTIVIVHKKITRKCHITNTNGRVKYITSEGGHLATEYGSWSENSSGFDNRLCSNNHTSVDPEYDSVDDASTPSNNNVKSIRSVGHSTASKPQETESSDFRNRMDSVPNVYSMEIRTNSGTQATLNRGNTGVSTTSKSSSDHYELGGSIDGNHGENINDEYNYANEEDYWEPASREKELKMQVEKLTGVPVINNEALEIREELGSGQFGTVYKGVWQQTADSEDTGVEAAVKTMEEGASEEERVKFLQEATIMGQFKNHPNIVRILGIVLDVPYKIVVELMHKGDLHHYLATLRPNSDQPVSSELSPMLLSYSRQVANGLMYLANKKYIHRDIAARNILVNDEGICKIADFGLSRDLFDENYYVSHGGKIPVKWTAPEAIHYRKYSTASDVWSYGCLLYEIWSLGVKPFHDVSNKQAVEKIDSGYCLPPPPGCPKAIYHIMIKCWHPTAASRLTPGGIVSELSHPDFQVLKWSQKDIDATSEKARTLGATLTEGHALYKGLQQKYMSKASN